MQMRILLVNPRDQDDARVPGPSRITSVQHQYSPPLGLMYLKSFLERETVFSIKLWNGQAPKVSGWAGLEKVLDAFQPELVGITTTSFSWYGALQSARVVRKKCPSAHIVMGGVHVWIYPEETLGQKEVDSVALSEGEYTLLELSQALSQKSSLWGIKGLWFKQEGKIIRNPMREPEKNPDRFPFPDRSEFAPRQYRLSADRLAPAAIIITGRGCPFHCTFCCSLDHNYRERSPENIVQEMLLCKELGYRSVDFYDDTFNITRKRVMAVCDKILAREVELPWICRCRVNNVDEEMISRMAEAGCERIQFGIESASQEILDRIKKGITIEQSRSAVRLAQKHGILALGYYMLGFPGEKIEQAKATIRFAFELNTDFAVFQNLFPAPGSEIYSQALADPQFGGDYLREFARNPAPRFKVKIWETAVSEQKLSRLLSRAYFIYYFRPGYILRTLARLGSFEDFITKLKSAWTILITSLFP